MLATRNDRPPLVSVVVPVYNRELHLERCVSSLLNQTYEPIEILLVDDGSSDSSGQICDRLAESNDAVRAIHEENGGAGAARNAGLAAARGEYIGFVDSDDWIAPDMYELLVGLVGEHDADAAQIGLALVGGEEPNGQRVNSRVRILEGKECLQKLMEDATFGVAAFSPCRCLFSRRALDSLSFREGVVNEDIDFVYKAFSGCSRMVFSEQVEYFYFQGGDSNSLGGLKSKDFDLYTAADILVELASKETYGSICHLAAVKRARTSLSLLCKIAYFGIADASINKRSTVASLQRDLRRDLPLLIRAPLPVSRKVLALLFAVNYRLTELMVHGAQKVGLG